jgi:microcystin-dependent protein
MSYRSSQQKVLKNILYSNNTLSGDLTGNNLASIEYVNTTITSINLSQQKNELITLQNELNNLISQLTILKAKNNRVIGSVIPTILLSPPINYLICNGQSLLVSSYPELFNIIGYNYGGSAGFFYLPDFRSYYILGGNSNENNLAVSNLFSGNGTTGATNNYLKFGSVFPSGFSLLTEMPEHTHSINDGGHAHLAWTDLQPFATFGASQYIKRNNEGNFNSATAFTGITLNSSGNNIKQIDPYSGLAGSNITQPFISVNFIICVN